MEVVLAAVAALAVLGALLGWRVWSSRRFVDPDAGSTSLLDDLEAGTGPGPDWDLLARVAKPRPVDELVTPTWLETERTVDGESGGSALSGPRALPGLVAPAEHTLDISLAPVAELRPASPPPAVELSEPVTAPRRRQVLLDLEALDDVEQQLERLQAARVEEVGETAAAPAAAVRLPGPVTAWVTESSPEGGPEPERALIVDVPVIVAVAGVPETAARLTLVLDGSGEVRSIEVREVDAARPPDVVTERIESGPERSQPAAAAVERRETPAEVRAPANEAPPAAPPEAEAPGTLLRRLDLDEAEGHRLSLLMLAVGAAVGTAVAIQTGRRIPRLEDYHRAALRVLDELASVPGVAVAGTPVASRPAPSRPSLTAPSGPTARPPAPPAPSGGPGVPATLPAITRPQLRPVGRREVPEAPEAGDEVPAAEPDRPRRRGRSDEMEQDGDDRAPRRKERETESSGGPSAADAGGQDVLGSRREEVDARAEARRRRQSRELDDGQRRAVLREKKREEREVSL
jgi:hypothetical protein